MSVSVKTDRQVNALPGDHWGALLLVIVAAFASGGSLAAQEPPVASFDAVAPDNPPAATDDDARGDNAEAPESTLSFSFRFAPWEDVLIKFADVAELTLDLTDVPPGTFNYYDKGRYSPREALDILNGYLLQRGFVLVRRDRFLVCVNLEKGIPANLVPTVTADELAGYGNNELVSVIFAHEDMDAALAASQVEQLQGPHGKVVALNATNSLLVMDTGSNLRLIQRLLDAGAFKRPATGGTGLDFKSFALRYVRADDAERLIRTMFGLPPALSASSATDIAAAARGPGSTDPTITTDARTNRLFVTASNAKLASIEQILAAYDVADPAADSAPQRRVTTTRILSLPNADVIVIGRALESLSPRIRVSTTRSAGSSAATETAPERTSPDKPADEPAGTSPNSATPQSPDGRDK
ncbi:MAG: hypothetical protein O3C40_19645 [Planctomycetota bacterium]|nr:hypothetical protein [Planctomycetota bacterium]